jgi:hypothetical protein
MSVAPLPAVIHHPWFIADIPGWNNDGVAEGESFATDRLYLENSIRKKEISQHLPPTVSTLLSDSGKRLFFQSAFHFKDIHEKFVRMHCPWTEKNIRAANSQLDAVLRLYPELGGEERVQEVKDLLRRNGEEQCRHRSTQIQNGSAAISARIYYTSTYTGYWTSLSQILGTPSM